MTSDETVQCVQTLLEDSRHLTITDLWEEMAAHFSHEANKSTIVFVYKSLRCKRFVCDGFLDKSWKNIEKITWERHSTSLLSTRMMGMTYLSE